MNKSCPAILGVVKAAGSTAYGHAEAAVLTSERLLLQVLVIFPTTIRRRILRHLYLRQVRNAYLFKGVRQKFIDALLGVARIELFMPQARPCTLAPSHRLVAACIPGPHETALQGQLPLHPGRALLCPRRTPALPLHSTTGGALLLPGFLTHLKRECQQPVHFQSTAPLALRSRCLLL